MRQGFLAAATFAAGLLALSPAHAATAPAPKIAVLDVQAVLSNSQRGQDATKALQQKATDLRTQANDLNDKRKALKDQLDKADGKSSDHDKLLKQFQDADTAFQNFVQEGNQLVEQRRIELLKPIQEELQKVVTQFVKDQHIDILLNKGAGALMAGDAFDVTNKVTEAMNKDWATQQAASPAPAASTKH
ncbi:MAG TPA: OmpH family outer membrane protein [Gammaproteobacteria bacterium]